MAETPGTITCKLCGAAIPLLFNRVEGDVQALRLAVVDSAPLFDHMNTCDVRPTGKALTAPSTPKAELVGRINQLLDKRAFIATAGSRACTMCGTNGPECLTELGQPGVQAACCPPCGAGNSHTAPAETPTCAQWAADRVSAD